MKIKKIVAATMPEAMKKVREELGIEAVILHSKEIRTGGFLGLFEKRSIEVIAALDPQPITRSKPLNKATQVQPKKTVKNLQINNPNGEDEVLQEIKYLKKILEQQSIQNGSSYALDYQLIYNSLIEQEVDLKFAEEIIEKVIQNHKDISENVTHQQIVIDTQLAIANRLADVSFQGVTYEEQIIRFVGPTGVGKTTTLAKIAANCMLKDGKKVAFITTDTYRIAAIEQLKTYARILDVPVEVAYTHDDYNRAIEKFSSYDVILVDTAGRNFRESKYVKELQRNININTKTYLVLSLTAKPKDMIDIYDQFNHLPIHQVIFTKIDETLQYGSMLNMILRNNIGIAYVTNGQDVPDDLIQPNPQMMADLILGGYLNE